MKTLVATLLVSSLAFAQEPGSGFTVPEDSPVLAPDVPEVSVRLRAGETAPFDGRLLSLEENLRRGKDAVDCKAELSEAKTNVWTRPGVIVAMVLSAFAVGGAVAVGATLALKK